MGLRGPMHGVLQMRLRRTGLLLKRLPHRTLRRHFFNGLVTARILRPNLIQTQSLRSGVELTPRSTTSLDTLLEGE